MTRVAVSRAGGPEYSETYDPDLDFDSWYTRATATVIRRQLRHGERVLELGCATGLMTSLFVGAGVSVVGVERSARYLARARARGLAEATFHQAELRSFMPDGRFDHVIATNLLHELEDPSWLLARICGWLVPGGQLHVTLPNPRSIHRLAALAAGLIDDLTAMSDRAVSYGTRRAWLADEFAALAERHGLGLVAEGGIALKPYPNATMAKLPPDVLDGLVRAADLLPRHAAMSYLVFRPLETLHDND